MTLFEIFFAAKSFLNNNSTLHGRNLLPVLIKLSTTRRCHILLILQFITIVLFSLPKKFLQKFLQVTMKFFYKFLIFSNFSFP